MHLEIISERDNLVIRRMVLAPGEAMFWHTDSCERFSVVVRGKRLAIEYASGERQEFDVEPGQADWDQPEPRAHRAVNVGAEPFEEVVTFYRTNAGVDVQPRQDPPR